MGSGLRLLRCRWRWLARHPARQRQGPGLRTAATPPPRSIATITTARSPTSRAAAASISRSTASASPSAITITTAATTSTSPRSAATICSTTKATAISAMSRASPESHNATFSASAAWLDYDRDGKLDLFVANYVQWTQQNDLWCSLDGSTKSYCTPESYKGTSSKLYHNLGSGKFEDVTAKAGLGRSHQQVARRGRLRLQQRWLARSVRLQRHAAQQALSQSAKRPVQGRRPHRRRRVRRRRRRARSHGRGRRRLRPLRPRST